MPGPIYQDSLTRCEPSSMLYDTIRNPRAPYIPPVQDVVKPDTIESTQQRVDREVLERFQGNGRKLPHDSFVAVVHVGKYIFMAIMLPPYLCAYGIPRWILVTAVPQMFQFVKHQSLHVGRFIQDLTSHLVDLMKGMVEQTIGDALKMTQQHAKNLWGHLTACTQSMIHKIVQAATYCQNKLAALQQVCIKPLTAAFEKISNTLQVAFAWTKEVLQKAGLATQAAAKNVFQALAANILSPVISWLQSPLSKGSEAFQAMAHKMISLTADAYSLVQSLMTPMVGALSFVGKQTSQLTQQLWQGYAQPVVSWLQDKVAIAQHALTGVWEKLAEKVTQINHVISEKISEILTPPMEAVARAFQMIPDLAVQAAYWMWGFAPKPIKHGVKSQFERTRRFGSALKRFGQGFSSGVSGVVSGVAKGIIVPLQKRWRLLRNLVKLAMRWLHRQLVELPRRVEIATINLWHIIKRMAKKLILSLRLAFAWIRVISKLGMGLVRELADEISGWIFFWKRT